MIGLDLDGSKLMGEAFSNTDPPLVLGDLSIQTGRDRPASGSSSWAVQGIRNPDAHEPFKALDAEEALETLAFASMLMRHLDETKTRQPQGGPGSSCDELRSTRRVVWVPY